MNDLAHLCTASCTFARQGCFFRGLMISIADRHVAWWHIFAMQRDLLDQTETNSSQAFAVVSIAAAT